MQQEADWIDVARLCLLSRALDATERDVLAIGRGLGHHFPAAGHDLAQVLLGRLLDHPHDAVTGYYRSRPLLVALGASVADVFRSVLARSGGYSNGRDAGVGFNLRSAGKASALPMSGGVGAQFTPAVGWATAIAYRREVLGDAAWSGAIAVATGGDGAVATGGFWSALTIATTERLPLLLFIEDNGLAISVPSTRQTPGGDIARNLASFGGLNVIAGDGANPIEAAALVGEAVRFVRTEGAPCLLRLRVPRLSGHSVQDDQAYRSEAELDAARDLDPLAQLRSYLVPDILSAGDWRRLEGEAERVVASALRDADAALPPDPASVLDDVYGIEICPPVAPERSGAGERLNMVAAIRRTLAQELECNPCLVVFGEDVGRKGGVHTATLGLHERFGDRRVFDTSLSEEGIVGRAAGLAMAGLFPVAEIQFRKYAEPATEQLSDVGSIRWRTAGRFQAPMVVRMTGGFGRTSDPWHSQTNEVGFVHTPGWKVAVPATARDAVGLLRTALRGEDPVIFFEHRALLDAASARDVWPGDDFRLQFGVARRVLAGSRVTVVTWGAMVERCAQAIAGAAPSEIDLLDLRTLSPWDEAAVLASVARTHRCLIVHEDVGIGGFGAEIAAVIAERALFELDAPIRRLAMPRVPPPYAAGLRDHAIPTTAAIGEAIVNLLRI